MKLKKSKTSEMKYMLSETIYSSKLYEVLAISPAVAKVIVQSRRPTSADTGKECPRRPIMNAKEVNENPESVSAFSESCCSTQECSSGMSRLRPNFFGKSNSPNHRVESV